jgi:HD-GYP domain-containing protein (c-di-GMP phosphodiesterase class II)
MVYSKKELFEEPESSSCDFSQNPWSYLKPETHQEVFNFARKFSQAFVSLENAVIDSWKLVLMGLPFVKEEAINDYITSLARQIKENAGRRSMKFNFGVEEVVQALKVGIAVKDISLEGKPCIIGPHNRNVSIYAAEICKSIGLPKDVVYRIVTAASLHDLGKIIVPNHILEKRSELNSNEFNVMKMHPLSGKRILQRIGEIFGVDTGHIATGIVTHQEKYGGGGYPGNLVKEQIPIDGQIIAIADSFDAMTSCRPYHKTKTVDEAIEELRRDPRHQFNPGIVDESLAPLESAYCIIYPSRN